MSDNAAGVACALEVARALQSSHRRNPVLLLFDDGEEVGLLGAELFMASERARSVGAVVNLEARGTSGASFLFETSRDNAWLVRRAVSRMPRPITSSVLSFVYDRLPNDTDLTVFKRAGLPGLNLAFIGSAARYHTPQDSIVNLSRASLQHHGDNALALVRALADEDLSATPAGDAVFFDLAGLAVLWWPKGLTPLLALLGLSLVRVAAVRRGGRPLPRVKVAAAVPRSAARPPCWGAGVADRPAGRRLSGELHRQSDAGDPGRLGRDAGGGPSGAYRRVALDRLAGRGAGNGSGPRVRSSASSSP